MISLEIAEQKLARYLAAGWLLFNRREGAGQKVGDQSDEVTDLEGVAAEIAFAKLVNVYPGCMVIGVRSDYDAVLPGRKTVDVKTTWRENGQLLASFAKSNRPTPHLYAMMVGTFPDYRCAGFFPGAELLKEERLTDLGYGPVYAISQRKLIPVSAICPNVADDDFVF